MSEKDIKNPIVDLRAAEEETQALFAAGYFAAVETDERDGATINEKNRFYHTTADGSQAYSQPNGNGTLDLFVKGVNPQSGQEEFIFEGEKSFDPGEPPFSHVISEVPGWNP